MHTKENTFPWRYLIVALACYSVLQVLFLGLAPIAGSTEAREAQVIDTIFREGEWILPLRNGIVPSKPPLFHWIGAGLSALLGGVSELSVRLPSHLAAVGILLCGALVAFRVARFSQTVESQLHQARVALLAPAILSLTYGFHQLASQAMVDMTFSFWLWGALTALVWSDADEWRKNRRISWINRAIFWIFCAGALAARGPIGVALPVFLVGIVGWYLAGFRATLREGFRPSLGWLAFLLPLAWYYGAYLKGGEAFIARQLFFENVQRFVGGEKINTESWWFYGPSLLRTTAPWGVLMLWGAYRYTTRGKRLSYFGGFQRWALTPTIALSAGLLLFSFSSGKRHSYLLPLQPLVAIQCALFISMYIERSGLAFRERLWKIAYRLEDSLVAVAVMLLVVAGISHELDWGAHPLEDILKFACRPVTFIIGLVVLSALAAMSILQRKTARLPYGRVWLLLVVLMTSIVSAGNVIKGTLKGWPVITEQLLLMVKSGQHITVIKEPFDEYFDPIFFYARRPITVALAGDGIQRCDPRVVYVARRTWIERNHDRIPGNVRRLTTLRELKRAFMGGSGEDLEVFVCEEVAQRQREMRGDLRDAVFIP